MDKLKRKSFKRCINEFKHQGSAIGKTLPNLVRINKYGCVEMLKNKRDELVSQVGIQSLNKKDIESYEKEMLALLLNEAINFVKQNYLPECTKYIDEVEGIFDQYNILEKEINYQLPKIQVQYLSERYKYWNRDGVLVTSDSDNLSGGREKGWGQFVYTKNPNPIVWIMSKLSLISDYYINYNCTDSVNNIGFFIEIGEAAETYLKQNKLNEAELLLSCVEAARNNISGSFNRAQFLVDEFNDCLYKLEYNFENDMSTK